MNDEPDHNLSDEEVSPQHLLASSFVDGEASEAERHEVQSSRELQALVGSFQRLKVQVADVPLVPSSTREAAFVAAMAAFDSLPAAGGEQPTNDDAGSASPHIAPVIDLSSRRRWPGRLLSAAAGLLLVGVVGIAVLNSRGTDDSSSSGATVAGDALTESAQQAEATAGADAPVPAATVGSFNGSAGVATVIDTPEQLLTLDPTATADLALPSSAPPDDSAAATADTQASGESMQAVTTTVDSTAKATVTEFASTRPALACLSSDQVFLADIQYQGIFAIAARDMVTGVTQAITDDCVVLASVGP